MPVKKKKITKTNVKTQPKKLKFGKRIVSTRLALFVILFAAVGVYFIVKSFAATSQLLFTPHFDAANSTGASLVKEASSPNKNNQDVVQLTNVTGATNSKAAFIDLQSRLDTGIYNVCLTSIAKNKTILGILQVVVYTNGAPGTVVSEKAFGQTVNTNYSEAGCTTLTNTTPNALLASVVKNPTDGGILRIGNISFNKIGEVPPPPPSGMCTDGAGSNLVKTTLANGFVDNPSLPRLHIFENRNVANNTVFDANGINFSYGLLKPNGNSDPVYGDQLYSIKPWSGSNVRWCGGRVVATQPDSANGDWQAWHDLNGFRVGGMNGFKFDGVYVKNFGDLINISDNSNVLSDNVTIQSSLLRHSHDDCIQNDKMASVLLRDSFLDGCYSGVSARFSNSDAGITDPAKPGYINGSGDTFTIEDSLIWMQPISPVYKGTNPGHGGWFKWENTVVPRGMKLSLKNVTLMARQNANHQSLGNEAGDLLTRCENVTILWTADSAFPERSSWQNKCGSGVTIIEGQAARDAWINKVNAWYTAHPQFNDLKQANNVYF